MSIARTKTEGQQPQRQFPQAARPPQPPQAQQHGAWKDHGWKVLRSAHVTPNRIFFGARAFTVGDELSEGVHVSARAIGTLRHHAETYIEARRAGEPTVDFPNGLRRVA